MPGRNGWGPMGQGPMTGGGRGWCGGATLGLPMPPGERGFGMGRGNGRGGGWRHRRWFCATGLTGWQRAQMGWAFPGAVPAEASRQQEVAALKEQAASLEQTLNELRSRIDEIERQEPDSPQNG